MWNYYIFLIFTLATILLLIASVCYYCIKNQPKSEILPNNMKFKNYDELKETNIKNCTCYYFDNIFNHRDLDLDNFILNEKYNESFNLWSWIEN